MIFKKKFLTPEVTDLLSNAATIGLHLVSATFIGLAMGYYLDKWLDTRPWFTLIMLVFGVAAGFKNVYQEARRIQRQEDRRKAEAQGGPESGSTPGPMSGQTPGSTRESPKKPPAEQDDRKT